MKCPSDKCGSSNIEHLPHYWLSLPGDSPLKRRYAQPAEGDRRAVLVAGGVAVLGLIMAVTGTVGVGLLVLAAGAVGAGVMVRRVSAAETARGLWQRRQICLACTHLWVP
jgi:hypothetical protein